MTGPEVRHILIHSRESRTCAGKATFQLLGPVKRLTPQIRPLGRSGKPARLMIRQKQLNIKLNAIPAN